MNFREDYKFEMDNIQRDKRIDYKILNKKSTRKTEKPVMATFAMICVVVMICNLDTIVSFSESVLGKYILNTGGEKMYLAPMEPVVFDEEKFLNDENTMRDIPKSSWQHFEYYEDFKRITGMALPDSEELLYSSIMVDIWDSGEGHLSMEIIYKNKDYPINGMFVCKEIENIEEWGYGENAKPSEIYKYGDGKKAYFIEDKIYDDVQLQKVYFSEGGILYQLFIERTEEDKAAAKEIINCMAE